MKANEYQLPGIGFTFQLGKKDVFVITDYKNKTESLARKILRKLLLPENPDTIRELLYYMIPGEIDIQVIKGYPMWNIHGKGFGGRGDFVHDGNTIVFPIWKEV